MANQTLPWNVSDEMKADDESSFIGELGGAICLNRQIKN